MMPLFSVTARSAQPSPLPMIPGCEVLGRSGAAAEQFTGSFISLRGS